MSVYVISDIHGHNTTFRKLLKKIKLKKTDKLILLGDLIDRGPDSKMVLDTVLLLINHGFDITCVMGNHEKMLLDSFEDFSSKMNWIRNGGEKTLESFLTSSIEKIPTKYIDFIKSFKLYHELENFIFVHAGIDMKKEHPFEDTKSLLWLRNWEEKFDSEWLGDRYVIHGHNPTKRQEIINQIKDSKRVIGIDNGSYIEKEEYKGLCAFNVSKLEFTFEIR